MSTDEKRQKQRQILKYLHSQNVPQPILNSVNFLDQPRSSQEQDGNYPFFQQRKNNANKYHTRNQPHHYTHNYFPSDDEEYNNQNHQRFSSNARPRCYSIDQPDIFETYTRNEQIGQTRTNPTPYNHVFQQQNPANTNSYRPTQMKNEIPLPC